jgi:phosphopantetheinyl transferase
MDSATNTLLPEYESEINALSQKQRIRAFFDAWTTKEAYSKAIGTGLGGWLNTTRPTDLTRERINTSLWSVIHLEPTPKCVATLVVEGNKDINLHCYQLC